MSSPPQAPQPLLDRLTAVAKTLKFAWWTGHVLTLTNTLQLLLGGASSKFFWALLGVLLSYGCIVFRAYTRVPPSVATLHRMARDDNVHYLLLGAMWLVLASGDSAYALPVLLPFAVFSTFHTLTFLASTLLPAVFPARPLPADLDPDHPDIDPRHIAVVMVDRADQWLRRFYVRAIELVALWETVVIPLSLALSIFTFNGGLWASVAYFFFVRERYRLSSVTRAQFANLRAWCDAGALNGKAPPFLEQSYVVIKDSLCAMAPEVYVPPGEPVAGSSGGSARSRRTR